MIIRHLCFTGPSKQTALIQFNAGLNIVYGPSNTGKSAIVDAVDFMLGRTVKNKLNYLPQHDGYDRILLGIQFSPDEKFTLSRSLSGGIFQCFRGLHLEYPQNLESVELNVVSSSSSSLSQFILKKLNLLDLKLRKNAKNVTVNLTLRNIISYFIIAETEIQKKDTPFRNGHRTENTTYDSLLKFFLTGVDDSALISDEEVNKAIISESVQKQLYDELILEQIQKIKSLGKNVNIDKLDNSLEELRDLQQKLLVSIELDQNKLEDTQNNYALALQSKNKIIKSRYYLETRHNEITEMLERFYLLRNHYSSDVSRLNNIEEAGSLILELPSKFCTQCGTTFGEHKEHMSCDGINEEIVLAAATEIKTLEILSKELHKTISVLEDEKIESSVEINEINKLYKENEINLQNIKPFISEYKKSYINSVNKSAKNDKEIYSLTNISDLQAKKIATEKIETKKPKKDKNNHNLPINSAHELSKIVGDFLFKWEFITEKNVHLDNETVDFVINGKPRQSNGKGYRAITHSATTLALMKYCEENNRPHLGFVILDSPLLAYEEPEDENDSLEGTNVNKKFFDNLDTWTSRQVIIFENKKSVPLMYQNIKENTHFTKSQTDGRFGFFPMK